MAVTSTNSVSGTVLIQYKHLPWTKPALYRYHRTSFRGAPCYYVYTRFEVLTVKLLRTKDFWDVTMCWEFSGLWHFKRLCCPHLEGSSSATAWPLNMKAKQPLKHQVPLVCSHLSHPRMLLLYTYLKIICTYVTNYFCNPVTTFRVINVNTCPSIKIHHLTKHNEN